MGYQAEDRLQEVFVKVWYLVKAQWHAVANSGQTLVTSNTRQLVQANTLFVGPCIQLKPWKAQAI